MKTKQQAEAFLSDLRSLLKAHRMQMVLDTDIMLCDEDSTDHLQHRGVWVYGGIVGRRIDVE